MKSSQQIEYAFNKDPSSNIQLDSLIESYLPPHKNAFLIYYEYKMKLRQPVHKCTC